MSIRISYILFLTVLSGCASVPDTIEPIQLGTQANTGTVWVGNGLVIRSVDGKTTPVHAKGSNAQSYARSLRLPAGNYSLSLYAIGFKSAAGGYYVPWDLTIEAGHTYLAETEPSAGGQRLVTTDYGLGSSCKGQYVKINAMNYVHEVSCTRVE